MTNQEIFKAFFSEEVIKIDFSNFTIDFVLTFFATLLISVLFNKYSKTLSNRQNFSKIFILLGVTTMMVIAIIKSSIALSLGLVGALSIIRFRAAIKDPEELVYIFLVMGIGLGFGSGNRVLTLLFVAGVTLVIIIKSFITQKVTFEAPMFLFLKFKGEIEATQIINILNRYSYFIEINRFQVDSKATHLIFNLKLKNLKQIELIKKEIKSLDNSVEITFTENKGLFT
jgi:hypothetical protein